MLDHRRCVATLLLVHARLRTNLAHQVLVHVLGTNGHGQFDRRLIQYVLDSHLHIGKSLYQLLDNVQVLAHDGMMQQGVFLLVARVNVKER